jgi:oxygen-independent coproporphyrinogen-3 oxidase
MTPQLLEEIPGELIERYLDTAGTPLGAIQRDVRVNGVGEAEYAGTLLDLGGRTEDSLAVYLHVPFCPVRCHYCACNTNITHDAERIDAYLDTLASELDLVTARVGRGREVRQLHVGGGTPNYLSDGQLARLMEIFEARFSFAEDACACIEANPRRASESQLELLRGLGFRHISFGVQDLNPNVQRAIGRVNSPEIVRDVYITARETGFENINVDLVYGLPEQTEADFAQTIEQILALEPDRVRCFSYAHAPALRPHQFAINAQALPGPTQKLALFHRAVRGFTDAGYAWIGIDCFARAGDEWSVAQGRQRLKRNGIGYVAEPLDHLLAFGTYGLGEVGNLFVQNEPQVKDWQRAVHAGRLPIAWGHRLSDRDLLRRRAYEHLMCNLELPAAMTEALSTADQERIQRCAEDGLLELGTDGIRVTPHGRFFLRWLCAGQAASLDWDSAQWRYPRVI